MALSIRGLATAVPRKNVNSIESRILSEKVNAIEDRHFSLLRRIYRRLQIKSRGSVLLTGDSDQPIEHRLPFYQNDSPSTSERMQLFQLHATPLAVEACQSALAESKLNASTVTHLITVCCTGFHAPGVDLDLIHQLGLNAGVQRTHVGFMGCHASLNALRVAHAFTQADPSAVVLMCSVELCSLHLQYGWNPEQVIANSLFADGAAAVVASHGQPSCLDDSSVMMKLNASGSNVIPMTRDLMHWKVGNHGFSMGLSANVPDAIAKNLQPWIDRWLNTYHYSLSDIKHWAVHPGGPRILQACADALSLSSHLMNDSRDIMSEYGNMSSATVLFVLDRMRLRCHKGPCVALAFGPGLSAEIALFEL